MGQGYVDVPLTSQQRTSTGSRQATVLGMSLPTQVAADLEQYEGDVMGQPILPNVVGPVASVATKAFPWAKTALQTAAPMVTYEAAKTGLEAMGVPTPLAATVATVIAGARRGPGKGTPTAPKPSGAPASPVASSPGVPVSPAAQGAPVAGPTPHAAPQWSPQRLRNEVGLAARRQNTKLTEQEYEVVEGMVKQGASPADAVKTVATHVAAPPATPKLKMNVEEGKVYMRLRGQGKSHQEAAEAIGQLRSMTKQFGLPSSKTVQTRVAHRNATGRWEEGR